MCVLTCAAPTMLCRNWGYRYGYVPLDDLPTTMFSPQAVSGSVRLRHSGELRSDADGQLPCPSANEDTVGAMDPRLLAVSIGSRAGVYLFDTRAPTRAAPDNITCSWACGWEHQHVSALHPLSPGLEPVVPYPSRRLEIGHPLNDGRMGLAESSAGTPGAFLDRGCDEPLWSNSEKNWAPFQYRGAVFMSRSINPHVVVRVPLLNLENDSAGSGQVASAPVEYNTTSGAWHSRFGVRPSGGTPWVHVRNSSNASVMIAIVHAQPGWRQYVNFVVMVPKYVSSQLPQPSNLYLVKVLNGPHFAMSLAHSPQMPSI